MVGDLSTISFYSSNYCIYAVCSGLREVCSKTYFAEEEDVGRGNLGCCETVEYPKDKRDYSVYYQSVAFGTERELTFIVAVAYQPDFALAALNQIRRNAFVFGQRGEGGADGDYMFVSVQPIVEFRKFVDDCILSLFLDAHRAEGSETEFGRDFQHTLDGE